MLKIGSWSDSAGIFVLERDKIKNKDKVNN